MKKLFISIIMTTLVLSAVFGTPISTNVTLWQTDKIKAYLDQNPGEVDAYHNPNSKLTLLAMAVGKNDTNFVMYLIEKGADPEKIFSVQEDFRTNTNNSSRKISLDFNALTYSMYLLSEKNTNNKAIVEYLITKVKKYYSSYQSINPEDGTIIENSILNAAIDNASYVTVQYCIKNNEKPNETAFDKAISTWQKYNKSVLPYGKEKLATALVINTVYNALSSPEIVKKSSFCKTYYGSSTKSEYWSKLTNLPSFFERQSGLDLAIIIGSQDLINTSIENNAPLTLLSLVYCILFERIDFLENFYLYGNISKDSLLYSPILIDLETFPTALAFARYFEKKEAEKWLLEKRRQALQ